VQAFSLAIVFSLFCFSFPGSHFRALKRHIQVLNYLYSHDTSLCCNSAVEKIRFVLESLRGEHSIAELCRIEGINQNLYYRWSKDILETGKKRLLGDT
jgi:hypothetical protein